MSGRSQRDSLIDDSKWPIPDTLGSVVSEGSALVPALVPAERAICMLQLCPDVFDGVDPFFLDEITSVVLGDVMT